MEKVQLSVSKLEKRKIKASVVIVRSWDRKKASQKVTEKKAAAHCRDGFRQLGEISRCPLHSTGSTLWWGQNPLLTFYLFHISPSNLGDLFLVPQTRKVSFSVQMRCTKL